MNIRDTYNYTISIFRADEDHLASEIELGQLSYNSICELFPQGTESDFGATYLLSESDLALFNSIRPFEFDTTKCEYYLDTIIPADIFELVEKNVHPGLLTFNRVSNELEQVIDLDTLETGSLKAIFSEFIKSGFRTTHIVTKEELKELSTLTGDEYNTTDKTYKLKCIFPDTICNGQAIFTDSPILFVPPPF